MAFKIELDTGNLKYNYRKALSVMHDTGRSLDDLRFHFIQDGDKQTCLVTTFDEHNTLPEQVKQVGITYKKLQAKALS